MGFLQIQSHLLFSKFPYNMVVNVACLLCPGKSSTNIERHLKKLGYVYTTRKKPQKRGTLSMGIISTCKLSAIKKLLHVLLIESEIQIPLSLFSSNFFVL